MCVYAHGVYVNICIYVCIMNTHTHTNKHKYITVYNIHICVCMCVHTLARTWLAALSTSMAASAAQSTLRDTWISTRNSISTLWADTRISLGIDNVVGAGEW